ncbi:DUF2490 domain-containing protein [Hyphococcus sp.]|uniref:DUF2490 domain-containing protein n=1 Tax=Hyphococcus sp. TaxID=2038636 RepID=UPI003D0BFB17
MKTASQKIFLAAALALAPVNMAAADDFQLWTAVAANGPVEEDGRFLVWFDGHARFRDDAGDLGVSILRPGVGWRLNRDLSLWAGYARVVSRQENAADVEENRLWQQATYGVGDVLGGSVTGRSRLEQRFIDGGGDTGWRVRQLLRYSRPLTGTPLSAVVSNETFIAFNDTDWGAASGYDQSRNFVGINYKATDHLAVESGYMLNHIRRDNAADAFNHVVSVSLNLSL